MNDPLPLGWYKTRHSDSPMEFPYNIQDTFSADVNDLQTMCYTSGGIL